MSVSKAPDYDTYGLFRALHSHNPGILKTEQNKEPDHSDSSHVSTYINFYYRLFLNHIILNHIMVSQYLLH